MVKRRYFGGVILCLSLATSSLQAAAPTAVVIGTLPQPGWSELSTQQKIILAPLAKDWEEMGNVRKKKWIGIADRYPNMKPDELHRTQERMREWANLTPEQRTKIRDSYKDFKLLPSEQKKAVRKKWEAYSSLPSEEKQRIRESGKSATLLAPPPAPAPALLGNSGAATEQANNAPPLSAETPRN